MRRLLFLISCLLCMGLSAQNDRKVLAEDMDMLTEYYY